MMYPVQPTGSCHEPVPAGDGCSDELLKGPFSQPSPAYARSGCVIEIAGSCLRKEVMAQMV